MKSFIKKFNSFNILKNNGDYVNSKKYKKTKFTRPLFFLDLSSRWDFICSFPVVFYIFKGLGIFTIPATLFTSLSILIIANFLGIYTVQRSNKFFKLSISLILLVLMFGRVSLSGVGIHLATQSKSIKNNKAQEILLQKNLNYKELTPYPYEDENSFNERMSNIRSLEEGLSPLGLLYIRARGSYYAYFNGDALAEEPFEMSWITLDPSSGILVKSDCAYQDEKCIGPVRWVSGNEAIKVATINFFEKYSRRDFNSLGFSFLGFFISLVLNSITLISFITLPKKSK